VAELVRAARGARIMVVQRRRRGWRRVVTMSTSNGVAAHAPTPVVVVPSEWTPEEAQSDVVVVGVEDALTAPRLLETALQEAERREGRLRVVHAWHYSDAYDDVVFAGEAAAVHAKELESDLDRDLAPILRRHADVPVELVVRHARPAEALTLESESADLLVLGRHRPLLGWGPHLGSVVRAVLRESACPVLVVDAAAEWAPAHDEAG
jgi:nucleotide-binding universal stress UspA family protein